MKDPIRRVFIALTLGIVMAAYNIALEDQYKTLSLYWIVYGVMRVGFWTIILYPHYRWRSITFWRKVIVVVIAIDFCLCFLPIDILLTDAVDRLREWIDWIVLVAILLTDRGDGGGGGRKVDNDEEEDNRELNLATDSI